MFLENINGVFTDGYDDMVTLDNMILTEMFGIKRMRNVKVICSWNHSTKNFDVYVDKEDWRKLSNDERRKIQEGHVHDCSACEGLYRMMQYI